MSTIEVGRILPKTEQITKSVDVFHEYYNAGEKEIKYITFNYLPYNSVNDVVACTASGKTEVSGRLTGPIPPKHKSHVKWESLWFNPTVATVVLTKIHIQYMDNTEEVIEGKDVISMENPNSTYYKAEEKRRQEEEKRRQEEAKEQERLNSCVRKLSAYNDGDNAQTVGARIAEVFLELKDDEKTLFKAVSKASVGVMNGYLIGDCIEKEYSSNKEFMKQAVSLWKKSIYNQKTYYGMYAKQVFACKGYPEKYAEKIRKYEPAYVMTKQAGCVTLQK